MQADTLPKVYTLTLTEDQARVVSALTLMALSRVCGEIETSERVEPMCIAALVTMAMNGGDVNELGNMLQNLLKKD